ncbi:5'-nucleotidase domain-containing protein 4 [Artemisia annua]|uniref:5'-nucleotidase domain-containing protein 4 n=1 Tax=Artemisia annua TaxID=35608 RepID=A0A2U1N443_ARTAN|nr:5'-nucleotidase domain-containing protein 4 [Artemisia annua]
MAGTTFNFNYAIIRNPVLNPVIVSVSPIFKSSSFSLTTSNTNNKRQQQHCQCSVDANSATTSDVITGVSDDMFCVNTSDDDCDVDYLGESTKGDLNLKYGINGQTDVAWKGPIEEVARSQAIEAEGLLNDLGIQDPSSSIHSSRGIFCTRTLNLRSISAIGYDMDYTLMHYNVTAWEGRAYDYCMENLKTVGFPVDGLAFDPDLVIRGLVIDKENGNLVKADRFGYVKRAMHGTKLLSTQALSEMYGRELVDLRNESRWEFLNTLFSVSEAVAYMQMVDRFDEGIISQDLGVLEYKGLYKATRKPEFFRLSHPLYEVVTSDGLMRPCFKARPVSCRLDEEPSLLAGLDRQLTLQALPNFISPATISPGHQMIQKLGDGVDLSILLATSTSDFGAVLVTLDHFYVSLLEALNLLSSLIYVYIVSDLRLDEEPSLLAGLDRQLTLQALPNFISPATISPGHQMIQKLGDGVDLSILLATSTSDFGAVLGGLYSGGSAQMVENSLGIHGDEILYVGDHIYTDVSVSKVHLRWRTALICRELEEEYNALIHSREHRARLVELLNQKEVIGDLFNQLRLALQRRNMGRPAQTLAATHMDDKELTESVQKLLIVMQRLDEKIAPMLEEDGEHFNKRWGYLSRADFIVNVSNWLLFIISDYINFLMLQTAAEQKPVIFIPRVVHLFTIMIHHGRRFTEPPKRKYVEVEVTFVDLIDINQCKIDMLDTVMYQSLGLEEKLFYHYKLPMKSLDSGLRSLASDTDIGEMLKYVHKHRIIYVYVEHGTTYLEPDVNVVDEETQVGPSNVGNETVGEADAIDNIVDEEHMVNEVEVPMKGFRFEVEDEFIDPIHPNLNMTENDLEVIDFESFESDMEDDEDSARRKGIRKLTKLAGNSTSLTSFFVGKEFPNRDVAKNMIRSHVVETRRNIQIVKNDKIRVRAQCFGVVTYEND